MSHVTHWCDFSRRRTRIFSDSGSGFRSNSSSFDPTSKVSSRTFTGRPGTRGNSGVSPRLRKRNDREPRLDLTAGPAELVYTFGVRTPSPGPGMGGYGARGCGDASWSVGIT